MCKVDSRTRIATTYVERIRNEFAAAGELGAFDTFISRATAVERAQAVGKTLFQAYPDHKVAEQYRALAREVLARLDANATQPEAVPKASEEPKVMEETTNG